MLLLYPSNQYFFIGDQQKTKRKSINFNGIKEALGKSRQGRRIKIIFLDAKKDGSKENYKKSPVQYG